MLRRLVPFGALGLLLLLVGGLATIGWQGTNVALHPPWHEHRTPAQGLRPLDPDADYFIWDGGHRDPGSDLGLAFEEVEIPTREEAVLRGWLVPGSPDAGVGVVAVHGGGSDRRDFLRQVPIFHRLGLPVVLFDCREHGISDGSGRGISFGLRESEDVVSAVTWARRELGLERVVVIGTSQGGASVLLAAAADPGIDVVIAENPFTSLYELVRDARMPDGGRVPAWVARLIADTALWRMGGLDALRRPSPIEAVGEIAPRPLLLMHGTADEVIPLDHSERLLAAAGGSTELWIVEGGEHAALFNRDPVGYETRIRDFLLRALPALAPPVEGR